MVTLRAMSDYVVWFAIYGLAGWCMECVLFRITSKKWVNRGFLHIPVLPIFGFGAGMFWLAFNFIPTVMRPLIPNVVLWFIVCAAMLFVAGGISACLLEYGAAVILENVFHTRWWDYDKNWGNIKGRIAPIGFVTFGAGCAAIVLIVHPLLKWVTDLIPNYVFIPLAAVLFVVMVGDAIFVVIQLLKKKKNNEEIVTANDRSKPDFEGDKK